MRAHRIIILIICLSINYSVFSQVESVVQWGGEIFKPASSTSFSVIGNWNEGVLVQAQTRSKLFSPGKTFIQRIDDFTLLPQYSKQIQLEITKGSKSLEYEVLQRLGNKPVLFATYYNREKEKIEIYGRSYSLEGEVLGKEKKVAELPATRKSDLEQLNFITNTDSSLMLTFFTQRFDKFSNEKMTFQLFNQELETLWNREIEFPYKGKNFSIRQIKVDRQGRIYALIRIQLEKDEIQAIENTPYRYSLISFEGENSLVEDYEIELGKKYIADIQLVLGDSGNVDLCGFYSSVGAGLAGGTFFLHVDRNSKIIGGKILNEFDSEFTSNFSSSYNSRGKSELGGFKLDHVVRFNDGNIGMVAEQFSVDRVCRQDFRTGMYQCDYYYDYNNILVVKISPEGELLWTADIPKYQFTVNDYGIYSSYSFGFDGAFMHFIFNDNPKNLTETDIRKSYAMNSVNKSIPVYARIGQDGSFKRQAASQEKKNRLRFIPAYSNQISDKSMLLFGLSSNKYRMGILRFD